MPSKRPSTSASTPSKRYRSSLFEIGSATDADNEPRLRQNQQMKEHAGGGAVNFSIRREKEKVESLKVVSLRTAARKIYDVIKFGGKDAEKNGNGKSLVGWDTNRDTTNQADILAFQQGVHDLSEETANLLLLKVLQLSHQALQIPNQPGVSTIAITQIFFSDRISKLSLSNLHFHPSLLNSIPQCTSLVDLDLAHNEVLADSVLAKVLGRIPSLRRINLKASTKVGDKSIIALAQGAGVNLQEANLSFTAVGVKGIAALLGACPSLEVLKLQAVSNLNEKNINTIVETAMESANKVKAIPLANLKTLKLKNTHVTDVALGRLLTLCAPTLARLDISFTDIKSLDIISSALHTLPTWNLEKLVASALPLTPASLESFFRPLAQNRTPEERNRLKVIKLGSIPATSARAPGMTDAVLTKLLPYWETFEGLENVSLHGNVYLGKSKNPMYSFLSTIGSRCRVLDLTSIPIVSEHLEGLHGPVIFDEDGLNHVRPSKLETLILDGTKIDDEAMIPLQNLSKLKALHIAETRISPIFLKTLIEACPDLSILNLKSCRGIPVTQRRSFFDSYEKGEVEV